MKRPRLSLRERGKIRLSEYFKELKPGDRVMLVPTLNAPLFTKLSYDKSYKGLAGVVKGKRGKCYIVEVKKGSKLKTIITHALHLKKL
ncbi:MAG: 50S ribosomal protein L21e [Candidatus Pacearchaeota archaeon]